MLLTKRNPADPILAWLQRHYQWAMAVVIAIGAVLRVLLVLGSPRPYGYVFDFYHLAVEFAWWERRLPDAADCWQCYHPPLFYVVSLPLFAIGRVLHKVIPSAQGVELRVLSVLPLVCGT